MHYDCEVTIDSSVEKVTKAFLDPEGIYEWMDGLESTELLEGEEGKKGAKTRLNFKDKKRSFSMIETIWESNLPEAFSTTYTMGAVTNNMTVSFQKIDENRTRYLSKQEFIFKNFGMKLMGKLAPSLFKKQTLKYMEAFKAYAEPT
ncbi:MAG: hypothetical protein ACJAQ4_001987 [Cryomorphaceae bacterium]|jgi:uncharacterized protein YndB with AHSA1/START domain